jgi:hypothetical protein
VAVAARSTARPRLGTPVSIAVRGNLAAARLLAGLVGLSFAVRLVVGWLRATPVYFGDEYLYSSLGRSIAEHGHPLVRGHAAGFPALLQPLVTAPAWLVPDVGVAYHVVQLLSALAISLTALPVYWLSRRLGLGAGVALGIAALALVLPDLVYASWIVAEPFAYPLALAAVAAAVAALSRPTRRIQLAFVALAALAAFARIQFVVLPACLVGAVLVVGLRERRLRQAVREQLFLLALLAVPLAVALALGPSRVLAFYSGVVHVHVDPLALATSSARNLLVLLYASGFVLVPGAIIGFGLAVARPRSRAELAFAAMATLLTALLLLEAGLFGAFEQAQERYVFYVLPLAAIGFGLYASRSWPHRLQHALLATGLVALTAVVPLAGYAAADEKAHSPLLYGVFRIEQWLGSPGNGSLAVALAATLGALVVAGCSFRPRVATPVALALAIAFSGALGASTIVFDQGNSRSVRQAFLPDDPSWVDHAQVGDVTLLRNIAGVRGGAFQQLFWNRSVKRLALMPGAPEIDSFNADRVRVADDGSLLAGGKPLTGALLVDEHAVTSRFTGVRKVESAPGYTLYRPEGTPRLSLFFLARYDNGWLADRGTIDLWPRPGSKRIEGSLVLDLESPAPLKATTVDFQLPGKRVVHVRVPAGGSTSVRLPVCSNGPWVTGFRSKIRGFVGQRAVSVKAGVPRFVAGSAGCAAEPTQTPSPPGTADATA